MREVGECICSLKNKYIVSWKKEAKKRKMTRNKGSNLIEKIVQGEKAKKNFAIWFRKTKDLEIKRKCSLKELIIALRFLTGDDYRKCLEILNELIDEEIEETERRRQKRR